MVSQNKSVLPKISHLSYAESAKKARDVKSGLPVAIPNPGPSSSLTNWRSLPTSQARNITLQVSEPHIIYAKENPDFSDDINSPLPTPIPATATDAPDAPVQVLVSISASTANVSNSFLNSTSMRTPLVNVWDARKEQMAAVRSAGQPKQQNSQLESRSCTTNSNVPLLSNKLPSSEDRSTFRPSSSPDSARGLEVSHFHNSMRPSPPSSGRLSEEEDPFVVRIYNKAVPPLTDSDSWPEVGKSNASTKYTASSSNREDASNFTAKEDHETLHGQGHLHSRKNEKPKWIPIPAQELQATADAIAKEFKQTHQHSYYSSRSSNNHNGHRSGSAYGKGKSRPHSTMHSHSGSLQSSPRLSKGKHLSGEEGGCASTISNGPRSLPTSREPRMSGETSPLVLKQHLQPRRQGPVVVSSEKPYPPKLSADNFFSEDLNLHAQCSVTYPIPVYSPSHLKVHSNSPDGLPPYDQKRPTTYPHYMQHSALPPSKYNYRRDSTMPLNRHARAHPTYFPHGPGYVVPAQITSTHSLPAPPHQYGHWKDEDGLSGWHGLECAPTISQSQGYHDKRRPAQIMKDERFGNEARRKGTRRPPKDSLPVSSFQKAATIRSEHGKHEVVFGTIGNAQDEFPQLTDDEIDDGVVNGRTEETEKRFTTPVSIGVAPGERLKLPCSRSRTHSVGTTRSGSGSGRSPMKLNINHIDATESWESKDAKAKWKFGTVKITDEQPTDVGSKQGLGTHIVPLSNWKNFSESGAPSSPSELHKRLEQLSTVPNVAELDDPRRNVFEVKDFGYGFGGSTRSGESISPPEREGGLSPLQRVTDTMEKNLEEEIRERASPENSKQSNDVDKETSRDKKGYERKEANGTQSRVVRRSGLVSGYSHYQGAFGGPKRGRTGYGRGPRRGTGGYGPAPMPPRGGMPHSFSLSPSGMFGPVVRAMGSDSTCVYYTLPPPALLNHPQRAPLMPYIPSGYEGYLGVEPPLTSSLLNSTESGVLFPKLADAIGGSTNFTAPVPVPASLVTFPLNPTKYLLGQLEYYLSPQNLAQDFFLRQRMDSRGWVLISLIASFKRVQQFAVDLHVVKEVLKLSNVVEVRNDWVRMIGWEKFVLPDAMPSTVEEGPILVQDETQGKEAFIVSCCNKEVGTMQEELSANGTLMDASFVEHSTNAMDVGAAIDIDGTSKIYLFEK